MEGLLMPISLPKKREFEKLLKRVNGEIYDVEHYRVYREVDEEVKWPVRAYRRKPVGNYAVVVTKSGKGYVGEARCNNKDQYNGKRGFVIAVGRALKRLVMGEHEMVLWAEGGSVVEGVELRDRCREKLVRMGVEGF